MRMEEELQSVSDLYLYNRNISYDSDIMRRADSSAVNIQLPPESMCRCPGCNLIFSVLVEHLEA